VGAELHRKVIENIVDEMALTLVRTSGSPVVGAVAVRVIMGETEARGTWVLAA